MGKTIIACRVCRKKDLDYALKIKGWTFVFCKFCTALQRADDIPYEIVINFEQPEKVLEIDYYPIFLDRGEDDCVQESTVILFSLKSFEWLLGVSGYRIIGTQVNGNKLWVAYEKMPSVDKLRIYEQLKMLGNKFTYMLYAMKQKKDE